MSANKVVPFRRRPPSQAELEAYQRMTRHWSPTLRQLMFPELFMREQTGEQRGEQSSPRR